ncbi:hypothetical protein V8Z79_10145 [Pantoea dispersa]|uniref:hypothetical protein n=1 Tax=Pantoea TaxID=53335 RepID=UPI000A74D99A|nr:MULTISPECIES: hypothetical protein [Pantoea]KAA8670395.1 hypothetical protein F4W08_13340 [Pantoea dispersa]NIG13134.1 hypothetical protein [Pantoea sp. Cy-640]UKY34836.1 hypothetical protein KFZ74_10670 [Pantoea dispersa]
MKKSIDFMTLFSAYRRYAVQYTDENPARCQIAVKMTVSRLFHSEKPETAFRAIATLDDHCQFSRQNQVDTKAVKLSETRMK